jgi:hypothetical protein
MPTYWSLEVNENTPALFDSNNNTRVPARLRCRT